jgi:hypothetical protein
VNTQQQLLDPLSRFLIATLPDRYREEIAGDLIEEALASVAPEHGEAAARRFIRGQLVRSLPATMTLHLRQREDDDMRHAKWIAAAAIVFVGVLQAWDSGILAAPPMIAALVAFAIAIGLVGNFIEHEGIRFGIALLVLVMLFVARILSPVRLPELSLVGLPIFLILVLGPKFLALRKGPKGPGAAA